MIWTPRQRRYLNILKRRRMTNQSRPVKFQPGTLVKYISSGYKKAFVVDHNSKEDWCWINHRNFSGPIHTPESELRRLTFGEFLWYQDPMTGGMKIGKNRAFPILLWLAIMLFCAVASIVGVEDNWRWVWPIVTVLSIGGVLLATYANFHDRQA